MWYSVVTYALFDICIMHLHIFKILLHSTKYSEFIFQKDYIEFTSQIKQLSFNNFTHIQGAV